ncbi:hypothetical protein QLQ12_41630 [Actinoplanes sp. NEAU-A12]|uniref:Anti-sigma factor n=1 Tax=Actinoplanes sandaracinus TaxID=3045177 RepID=A0ABT6WZC7_9ACTN|nr:hypothetical protein [Actinoplanes sandaracinus]MDI6105106.1 hypothetical protein [Actinoplanes sandaracinus]
MTDDADQSQPPPRPSQQLAALLGLPEPEPFTEEEERAFERWMDEGDAQQEAIIARRRQQRAA